MPVAKVRARVLAGAFALVLVGCASSTPVGPLPRSSSAVGTTPVGPSAPASSGTAGQGTAAQSRAASGRPPSAVAEPRFRAAVAHVTRSELAASWRTGCPVSVADLRAVDVSHWDLEGNVRTGRLVVAAKHADTVISALRVAFAAHFPIERMRPIAAFGGSDDASMEANNTSAFNCRKVTGGSAWSEHSYGRAIDINPLMNPYVRGRRVLPRAGSRYLDRTRTVPGMIAAEGALVRAFAERHWVWGGTWTSLKDYQHFSSTGR